LIFASDKGENSWLARTDSNLKERSRVFGDYQSDERSAHLRHRMVEAQVKARGVQDERVLSSMSRVPRHEFVPPEYRAQAYADHPIPIDQGQTISQPFIVAVMLEHLQIQPQDRVLEIGTGSGYMTALLAELADKVYSIERHPPLANSARELLTRLHYRNIEVIAGDGNRGWPEHAPYHEIAVSAAAMEIPPALLAQLREGGRMIIPIGPADAQLLQLVRKQAGKQSVTTLDACRFVPLLSGVDVGRD
jgi:protein-L-isoaspartate(D-aspartate) O-methyltransferase